MKQKKHTKDGHKVCNLAQLQFLYRVRRHYTKHCKIKDEPKTMKYILYFLTFSVKSCILELKAKI